MNGPWAYNATAPSITTSSYKELLDLTRTYGIRPSEPIVAIKATLAALGGAIAEASVKAGVPGVFLPSPLDGLDVVEEEGWVYAGTTRQLAEARRRWGSLTMAREAWDRIEEHRKPYGEASR